MINFIMQRDETPLAVSGVDTGRLATVCIPGGTGTNCTFDKIYKEEFLEMKNLKKVLALVLAMSTVFGLSVSAGAAASDLVDYDEIQNKEAVEVMAALNVIGGNDKGEFNPDSYLTRAEMCKMVSYVMNGGKAPVLGSSASLSYTDTAYSWAKDYIEYATSMGIVGGVGGGKFSPDGTLTGTQAAKMMLTAMGYDATVFGFGGTGWDVNVNRYANETGLYNGLSDMQPNLPITRDQAAQLMYNAMQATMVRKTWSQNMETGQITEGYEQWYENHDTADGSGFTIPHTLLADKYDGAIRYAYMTGYAYDTVKQEWEYSFTSNSAFGGNAIPTNKQMSTQMGTTQLTSSVDYTDFYGQRLKVIYNSVDEDVIYGIYASDSSVVVTGASGDASEYNDVANTVTVSGKSYKLNDDADTIDVYYTKQDTTIQSNLKVLVDDKDIDAYEFKMVDNTGDGKIDAVIETPMAVAKINYVGQDQLQFTVYDTNTMSNAAIDLDDLSAYEGYAVNDWVYFTKGDYSKTGLHTIEKAELKTGTVDAIRGDDTVDKYVEYQLGGVWYKAGANVYQLDDAEVGDTVEYVTLGSTVFHMAISDSSFNTRDIALVVSVGVENTQTSNIANQTLKAKLLFGDGSTSTVTLGKYEGTSVNAAKYNAGGDIKTLVDSSVGKLVSFRVNGGKYELTDIDADNKLGLRNYVDSATNVAKNDEGYNNGKIADELLADDALIFVLAANQGTYDSNGNLIDDGYAGGPIAPSIDNEGGLYTGLEFKNQFGSLNMSGTGDPKDATAQYNGKVLTSIQNGFDYVKVAVVHMEKLPDITIGSNYGYLTQAAYRTEENNQWYLNYTLWTPNGEVKGKYQTNDAPSEYPAGTLISYDVKAEGEFKNVSKPEYNLVAITAWDADKGNIKFSDGVSSEIDSKSTQVIYVDSATHKGSTGGAIQIAADTVGNDKVGDQVNVMYIGTSNKVAVLVVDINNKMIDTNTSAVVYFDAALMGTNKTAVLNQLVQNHKNVTITGNVTLTTGSTLTVPAGTTLTFKNDLTLNGATVTGAGSVVVEGTTNMGSTLSIASFITNQAEIDAGKVMTISGGKVSIKQDLTGSGKLVIDGTAAVTVTGKLDVNVTANGSATLVYGTKGDSVVIDGTNAGGVTGVYPYSTAKDTTVRALNVVK